MTGARTKFLDIARRAQRAFTTIEYHHSNGEHGIRPARQLESRAATFVDEDQHPASL
jgi:hypothetical protein